MTDDIEHWERLQELFHLAERTPEAERERVLEEACDDPELRRRAAEILVASSAEVEAAEAPPAAEMLTSRIGPYRLLRHVGSGGLGAVYLAERSVGGVMQRSALKVLAPHARGAAFIERFYREQQILASLDHPHITHMFDAGVSETGQPYLVMEYVDGVHLDKYCDEHKLTVEERIRLFLQVCDAVAYAHRNLVVHLDLKPSNILVTADGTVKLLDFGTSKVIEADSLLTTTVLATPAYASPEQLRNEGVTTACDIYSLGAVLFELLTGRRPGERGSVAMMIERAMREQEPEALGTAVTAEAAERRGVTEGRLRQALGGDLATIVSKCLRPRPLDRYLSLDVLTEDLKRYLEGRPVLARPQTTLYRVGKFVRRNRKSVLAAGLLSASLGVSVGYALWAQERAVREGQRAMRMQTFLYKLFRLANSNYTGKPSATVREFLQLGVRVLPQYIQDPADLREAQMSLAESMFQNDDLEDARRVFTETIGSAKAAGDVGAEAESEAFAGNIAYLQGRNEEGATLTADALALSRQAKVSPSVKVWSAVFYAWNRENNGSRADENVDLLRMAVREAYAKGLSQHETADAVYDLGEDMELRGQLDEAEKLFRQALQVYGDDPSVLCDQSQIEGDLAYAETMRGNYSGSVENFRKAYEGASRCSGPDSRGALDQQQYYVDALVKVGRAEEALPLMVESMPAWRRVDGDSPDLAEPLYFLAEVNLATGHFREAEAAAKEAVDVQEGKVAPTDRRFGAVNLMWAKALAGQGREEEALPHAEIAERLLGMNAVSPGAKKMGAEAHEFLLELRGRLAKR